jgi:hypothetical protein
MGSAATVLGFRMQSLSRQIAQVCDRHLRLTDVSVARLVRGVSEVQVPK